VKDMEDELDVQPFVTVSLESRKLELSE